MPPERGRGSHVVAGQPGDGGLTVLGIVGLRECAGILPDQVMQPVTAACWLGHQMLVEKLAEAAAGIGQAGAVEGSGSVRINVRSGVQAEAPEQPLLAGCQVPI
jgi:hypothetical protein